MTGIDSAREVVCEFASRHSRDDRIAMVLTLLALGQGDAAEYIAQADAVICAAEDAAAGGAR